MSDISIPPALRDRLREHLLEEQDLLEGIRHEELTEISGRPGRYRCTCTLALRRPLDPETAEMRRLQVVLRRLDSESWEVEEVEGLAPPSSPGA